MSDVLLGLAFACLTSLCFGSVFVPIRTAPAGDGVLAQLFLCLGGFVVCLTTHIIQGCPQFYPLAMLGGSLWCIGNCCAIPIMNKLGMGLALLVWNVFSCLTGWASQRYGLFGLVALEPANVFLNYIGIIFLLVGGASYALVKPEPKNCSISEQSELEKNAYYPKKEEEVGESLQIENELSDEVENHINPGVKVIYIFAACIAGLFYGNLVTPVTYIITHPEIYPNAPNSYLPYLFSIWMGILLTSIVVCIGYSVLKRNRPLFHPEALIPSFISGIIMGLGFVLFLICNQLLSQAIASPVCVMAPGFVVALWSTLYFKEIKGRKNLIILGFAYIFTLLGVVLVAVSKE